MQAVREWIKRLLSFSPLKFKMSISNRSLYVLGGVTKKGGGKDVLLSSAILRRTQQGLEEIMELPCFTCKAFVDSLPSTAQPSYEAVSWNHKRIPRQFKAVYKRPFGSQDRSSIRSTYLASASPRPLYHDRDEHHSWGVFRSWPSLLIFPGAGGNSSTYHSESQLKLWTEKEGPVAS